MHAAAVEGGAPWWLLWRLALNAAGAARLCVVIELAALMLVEEFGVRVRHLALCHGIVKGRLLWHVAQEHALGVLVGCGLGARIGLVRVAAAVAGLLRRRAEAVSIVVGLWSAGHGSGS